MNYSVDNKIWRVGGPLFAYLAINYAVQLAFSIGIFYVQFNEWNINAAFNGLMYAEQLGETKKIYLVAISGVSALISLPVFAVLLKKDYEYPVNRHHKERSFDLRQHIKQYDKAMSVILAMAGILATVGLSRLILMLPIDGILGDYSEVKEGYEAGSVWLQFFVLGIITPIVEELLFRGIVYNRLKIYFETTIAAYISSIIFGVAHFNLVQGIYAFIMGIMFTFIYERCRNIYAPIIMHVTANLTAVITSVNPVSIWVDEHVWIKFPLALVETVGFVVVVSMIYKKTDTTDIEESDTNNESNIQKSKFDFHI